MSTTAPTTPTPSMVLWLLGERAPTSELTKLLTSVPYASPVERGLCQDML